MKMKRILIGFLLLFFVTSGYSQYLQVFNNNGSNYTLGTGNIRLAYNDNGQTIILYGQKLIAYLC